MTTLKDLGSPIATGRSAEIYAWPSDSALVVKLFPADYPSEDIDAERAACLEADRLGINPLATGDRVEIEGRSGLLFERLDGDSLTRQAEKNPLTVRSGSRILAQEHAKLHGVSTTAFPEVKEAAVAALDTEPMAFLSAEEREQAIAIIRELPDGDRVLHMDFHTENVFSHQGGHAVIDWPTAMRGAPAADVAATFLLLNDAELWPGTPWIKRVAIGSIRKIVLSTYLAEYQRITGMTRAEIDQWRLVAVIFRMSILDIPGERPAFVRELHEMLDAAK